MWQRVPCPEARCVGAGRELAAVEEVPAPPGGHGGVRQISVGLHLGEATAQREAARVHVGDSRKTRRGRGRNVT